ncbi:MAG: hypothetical protein WCB79_00350 [Halobacteriota archaeon]
MELIEKSKVTKLNAKAGIVHPLIRLPKIYADEIVRRLRFLKPSTATSEHSSSLSTD